MKSKRAKAGTSKAAAAARRERFVEGMLICNGNQTQAAIYAGCPERGAHVAASRMLKEAKVSALLAKRQAEQLAKSKATSDEVLISATRDLRFDPAKLVDDNGNIKALASIDEDTRLALRGMEQYAEFSGKGDDREQTGTTTKVKFPEKTAAREQLMKHFGLYEKDNSQKPPMAIPVFNIIAVAGRR